MGLGHVLRLLGQLRVWNAKTPHWRNAFPSCCIKKRRHLFPSFNRVSVKIVKFSVSVKSTWGLGTPNLPHLSAFGKLTVSDWFKGQRPS